MRQEAQKAAAAKAAAERAAAPRPPPYNANGALVHLHRGKAELDDILRQTGAVLQPAACCSMCGTTVVEPTLMRAQAEHRTHPSSVPLGTSTLPVKYVFAGDRQLVVLDFSASWCGPCRMMEPVLQGWARELGPEVVFIKCDAEAPGNRALAASSGIRRAQPHSMSIGSG